MRNTAAISGEGQGRLWSVFCLGLYSLLLTLMATSTCFGQGSTAVLGGKVFDAEQGVIPKATVVVVGDETGVRWTATTNEVGSWRVDALVAGHYHFSVSAPGFATTEQATIELQVADQKFIDVTLKVGAATEKVVVSSSTPLIDTTAAVSGTVLTNAELTELPSISNSPHEFVSLTPGVVLGPPSNGNPSLWGSISASNMTINASGTGTNAVNYVIDGGTDTITSSGQIAFIPPMDSVHEVRVTTNAYDASIGRTAAGTLNISLKSGGRDFHGVMYERNQNTIFNANYTQYIANGQSKPTVHFNEWGGTLGGPVWIPKVYNGRDHGTFFFFSYDGIHNQSPFATGYLGLPTPLERQGDLSQSYTTTSTNGNLTRYPLIAYDPATVNPATGDRQPFPNAQVPQARWSPIAKAIIDLLPLPNAPGNGTSTDANDYLENDPKIDKFTTYSGRVDQAWNNNHHSYFEYRYNQWAETYNDPFGPTNFLDAALQTRHNNGATIDHTWLISPNLVATFHVNMTAYNTTLASLSAGLDPTKFGFSQNLATAQTARGIPDITGAFGLTLGTSTGPQYESDYEWEGKATILHTHGNHTLHYGAEYLLQQEAVGNTLGGTGAFNFTSAWTTPNPNKTAGTGQGSTTASFLLGLPNTGSLANNATAFWVQPYTAFFVQDDWRVTPKLTLNVGLRWDYQFDLTERHNRYFSRFDPDANITPVTSYAQPGYAKLIAGASSNLGVQLLQQNRPDASTFVARGAILYAGKDGTSRSITNPQWNYFQPRLGFAYRFNKNTVIAGGLGRFGQATFISSHGNQLGYSSSTPFTATNDNYITSAATLDNPFPSGLVPITGNSLGEYTSVGSVSSFYDPDIHRQYTDDYSLRLEQQVGHFLFQIGGVFENTRALIVAYDDNHPSTALWRAAWGPAFDSTGRPVDTLPGNTQVTNPFLGAPYITSSMETAKTVAAYQLLLPNPLGYLTESKYNGSSEHYALQTKIERRFENGLGLNTNFSWGKQMDKTSYFTNAAVSEQLHRQLSTGDVRFAYTFSPTYVLPFGRGKLIGKNVDHWVDSIIGGWEVSALYNFDSGTPVSLPTNSSFFQGGDPGANGAKTKKHWFNTSKFVAFPSKSTTTAQLYSPSYYPAWTGAASLPGYSWVPTSSSDAAKNGVYNDFNSWSTDNTTTYGNVRNPWVNNWNIGLRKNVPIHEDMHLQLRLDAFNALNHPQMPGPGTDPTNQYFGWIGNTNNTTSPSQTNAPRQLQLEGKLYF